MFSPLSGESFSDIDGNEHLRPLLALRGERRSSEIPVNFDDVKSDSYFPPRLTATQLLLPEYAPQPPLPHHFPVRVICPTVHISWNSSSSTTLLLYCSASDCRGLILVSPG